MLKLASKRRNSHLLSGQSTSDVMASPPTTSLYLWLKADGLIGIADGSAVQTWPDSSGNGRDATQATGGNRPTFRLEGVNKKPSVEFNGAGHYMTLPNLDMNNFSVFVVFKRDTVSASDRLILSNNVNGWGYYLDSTSSNRAFITKVGVSGANGNSSYPAATNHRGALIYNGATAAFYRNGVADGTPAFSATFSSAGGNYSLGSRAAAEYFDGHLMEIILYSVALDSTNRDAVDSYLSAKYGF